MSNEKGLRDAIHCFFLTRKVQQVIVYTIKRQWSTVVAPPRKQEQLKQILDQFVTTCRTAGLKITHQRTEIYRQLLEIPDHPSVEKVHKRLLSTLPTISLDTVYSTLTTLEQHGLVFRIQTAENQARFEEVDEHHHHLISTRCKQMMDFQWPEIEALERPPVVVQWGKITSKTLVVYGICSICSDQLNPLK